MRHRPFGIRILAILAGIAGVIAAYHTLQYLHIMPVWLGSIAFWGFDPWGAVVWGLATVLYAWVVAMLWRLDPAGWLALTGAYLGIQSDHGPGVGDRPVNRGRVCADDRDQRRRPD